MWYGNLQVGRIAAASGVLFAHAVMHSNTILGIDLGLLTPTLHYYYRGTAIFLFALSGFVLARSLQSGKLGLYVVFRLMRIFPAYWAAVALVMLGRTIAGEPGPPDAKLMLRALFLIPSGKDSEIYHPFYTLGIEWTLMYELFLSMTIVPLAALGRRRGLFLGCTAWLAACLVYQAVAPGALRIFPKPTELPLSAINAPFLFGVLVYFTHERWGRFKTWVLLGGLVMLTSGTLLYPKYDGWSYILEGAGISTIVGYLAAISQIDAKHQLATAGEWSYGLYLLHAPILVLVFSVAAALPDVPRSAGTVLLAGAVAFLLGSVFGEFEWRFYRWIQRRIKNRLDRRVTLRISDPPAPSAKAA